ncbi:NH(3)-dependent NAD(+) synthetase [mine drainage metagenome]|uniref:NH(3)-dependent NAD(+) synthetase n=1 Tax=mine drainage metagenome TaxID=410659 RepID=A0A1J5SDP4_9ZZZZ
MSDPAVSTAPQAAHAAALSPARDAAEAARRLDAWFAACPGVAVAFSGGVDSALVAYWARRTLGRTRATAWIADSPSLKRDDLARARDLCAAFDIPLQEIATDEIDNPDYASNPVDRCFHCKTTLYSTLAERLAGRRAAIWICSGANLDDQGDYRPGLRAASDAHVRHPLMECGLGKTLIRELARAHGLPVWNKPASPCLSSRIPYGQAVTRDKLAQIEAAEAWLQRAGFEICRVRHFGDRAGIEVPPDRLDDLRPRLPELREAFSSLGFTAVEIDPEGFVSGKLNRAIARPVS